LELEEKAMAIDDKIQVSKNEGSVLGTRRLWSRGFQVSKILGLWLGTWKKKGKKEEEEGMAGRMTRAAICLSVCVFVIDIRGLRWGQPLRGPGRGATTFYTSSVDAWCSLGPNSALNELDGGAQGTMGGPNRPRHRAQDLQGRLKPPIHGKRDWSGVATGYLLVVLKFQID
jgi:hypothetical protein